MESVVPYRDIPHFPVSTVESHAGELHLGTLSGRPVAVMKGRVHYYEGYTMRQVAFPVRVLKALGCETLVITSACGGMNPDMPPGTIVAITDHINLMGDNPLIGDNDETLGPRFPDMSEPYARDLIARTEATALELEIPLQRGIFVAVPGPNLETAAEYRFLRWIGADVVGMSLVPENLRRGARRPARAGLERRHRRLPARSASPGGHSDDPGGGGANRADPDPSGLGSDPPTRPDQREPRPSAASVVGGPNGHQAQTRHQRTPGSQAHQEGRADQGDG